MNHVVGSGTAEETVTLSKPVVEPKPKALLFSRKAANRDGLTCGISATFGHNRPVASDGRYKERAVAFRLLPTAGIPGPGLRAI
jgi:hypothetical protein